MKVNLIVDLQFGSTGKGLLAGYLAEITRPDVVVTCNMPNAGHTYIDSRGNKMIFKVLPNGAVSESVHTILIGPGAVFSWERLVQEIDDLVQYRNKAFQVMIHPNAVVLQEQHAASERELLNGVASTMQGSAAAMVHKILRQVDDNPTAAADPQIVACSISGISVSVCDHGQYQDALDNAALVQAEGSQGFSLGINQRFYPYCTSRECTPHRMLSDMGLPARTDLQVFGTLRTYPIRVGNTEGGFSGDNYPDQVELTWDDLEQVPETTTVTGRIRRVFTFSRMQLEDALWHSRPDHLFLNFCNYMNEAQLGQLVDDIEIVAERYDAKLSMFGYGPSYDDVLTVNPR